MQMKAEPRFVLGLDGGGSYTKSVILDETGAEIGRGLGGASNHQSVGVEAAKGAIAECMEKAIEAAGNPILSFACWGMAGLDRLEDETIIKAMTEELLPQIPVKVVHDSTIALVGGTGGKNYGVVIISGTGSIIVGYHPSGEIKRAGGWGHLLGDEGSGYQIALQGLNAATRAYDDRDHSTSLVEAFTQEASEAAFETLVSRIYLDGWSAPEIAALAPVVLKAAEKGDKIAQGILNRAAEELAMGAKVVIHKLGMQDDVFDVVLSGGIFTSSPQMEEQVREIIQSFAPTASIFLPLQEPLIGAGMIALQSLQA